MDQNRCSLDANAILNVYESQWNIHIVSLNIVDWEQISFAER